LTRAFNLAIDSKLRGCDLVALRVDDVAPNGYAIDRANVRQRKTGRPVRFELTEVTRQALDDYLRFSNRKPGQCLFPGRRGPHEHLTTRQYARWSAIPPIATVNADMPVRSVSAKSRRERMQQTHSTRSPRRRE
jgi:integrase